MARNTTPDPETAQNSPSDQPSAVSGFDAIVRVPSGASVDEALTAFDEDVSGGSGMASAELSQSPSFDAGEAAFPRLRLAQGLTPEVAEGSAKMGQWLFSGYDPMNEVVVIPVMLGRARNKRENPQDRNSPIACSSSDGRIGVGNPGRACRGCPFAGFSTDPKTGRRLAPACTLTYTYACWAPGLESFVEINFSRTSEQTAHLINNLVQLHGLGRFALRLSSNIIRGTGRIYAVPQIRLERLTAEMVEGAMGLIPSPTAQLRVADTHSALPAPAEVTS